MWCTEINAYFLILSFYSYLPKNILFQMGLCMVGKECRGNSSGVDFFILIINDKHMLIAAIEISLVL